jgi:hypothetical protein
VGQDEVDDAGVAGAADVQASAADPTSWLGVDGGLTVCAQDQPGAPDVWAQRHFQRPHEPCSEHVWFGEPHPSNCSRGRVEDVLCTGNPVSVVVQAGGYQGLVIGQVTKLTMSAPGQAAAFSLPAALALPKTTSE